MSEKRPRNIVEYLQRQEIQESVHQRIKNARSEATVSISRAAKLFNFSENQLRGWERRGWLHPQRPVKTKSQETEPEDEKKNRHREYSQNELDRLAIIRELMDRGFTLNEITQQIESIWSAVPDQIQDEQPDPFGHINGNGTGLEQKQVQVAPMVVAEPEHLTLDQRVERTNQEIFWRYFVSQALRLSLMLLCEDVPDTIAALMLPLEETDAYKQVHSSADLSKIGETLTGWLDQNGSFYTFLNRNPTFDFATDFRVEELLVTEEDRHQDNTFLVLQRKAASPVLQYPLVDTVRRLLAPIYSSVAAWRPCFDYGPRDWMYQVVDFNKPNPYDKVLDGLANTVVSLGGKIATGKDKWRFCCFFLPKDTSPPLQQRNLVVRAQSKHSPHIVGKTTLPAKEPALSLKAFQSGHIIYRPSISPDDSIIAYQKEEGKIGSAIAIPVGGEDGLSTAVMYITSDEQEAFSDDDQRLLRIISRMVEELLQTYQARQQISGLLSDLIANPGVVDASFKDFESENEFINDLEKVLTTLEEQTGELQEGGGAEALLLARRAERFREDQMQGAVSYIALEIDGQSSRAYQYGDRVTRNLVSEVGARIRTELTPVERYGRKLYHISADRFYLLLENVPLEETKSVAAKLKQALKGDYPLSVPGTLTERSVLPGSTLELKGVTVRMGVSTYPNSKLRELLKRYPSARAVTIVRNLIAKTFDNSLEKGQQEGGDVIISWDPDSWAYTRWDT